MRLYLSSQDLGDHADRLLAMLGDNKKMLFIDNAKDFLPPVERADHTQQKRQELEQIGLVFEELDLRDYFGKKADLHHKLDNVGLIFADGGNTFILRRAMYYSGFDTILTKKLMDDAVVYAGSSAGAVVATPSLHGAEFGNDLQEIPAGYKDEIIWKGLNLVDFYLVPHYLSDWFGDTAHRREQYFKDHDLPYKTLMDGQVFVWQGTQQELLA